MIISILTEIHRVEHNIKCFDPIAIGVWGKEVSVRIRAKTTLLKRDSNQQQPAEMNKLRQSSSCWSSTRGFNEARLT